MNQTTPIVDAIQTLSAGDVITRFACGSCTANKVLVLKRHDDGTFDFSARASKIVLVLDKNGPFRWDADVETFTDKEGLPYDHIDSESLVIVGGGETELGWYKSLPSIADAPYSIDPRNLPGDGVNPATMAKMEALLVPAADTVQSVLNMQLAIQTVLGGITLSEEQMRCMLILISTYTGRKLEEQEMMEMMGGLGTLMRVGSGLGGDPRHHGRQ